MSEAKFWGIFSIVLILVIIFVIGLSVFAPINYYHRLDQFTTRCQDVNKYNRVMTPRDEFLCITPDGRILNIQ